MELTERITSRMAELTGEVELLRKQAERGLRAPADQAAE
jgi:hypothetical protein